MLNFAINKKINFNKTPAPKITSLKTKPTNIQQIKQTNLNTVQKRYLQWAIGSERYVKNREFPAEDIPDYVEYNGPETLRVAYVLDRPPVLMRDSHPIEKDFEYLSFNTRNHYVRHPYSNFWEYFTQWQVAKKEQDKQLAKLKKKRSDLGPDGYVKVPPPPDNLPVGRRIDHNTGEYMDKEKKQVMMLKAWNPSPRYTQADLDDDRRSINRKLDHRLFFIVKNPQTKKWQFPTGIRRNPHTLRMAANYKFWDDMGKQVYAYFLSNAPLAHFTDKSNPNDTTFFYHAFYLKGRPPFQKMAKEWAEHAWVTRKELADYDMLSDSYKNICYNMLWDGYDIS